MKQFFEKTSLYPLVRDWSTARHQRRELVEWERNGKPSPPPHLVKQRNLRAFANRFGLKILVETGTYYGDMVQAMKDSFDKLYSIELSPELFQKAMKRFQGIKRVELIHGDSGIELGNLIKRIDAPTLFWLDGHYSAGITAKGEKETPIYEELRHILDAPDRGHVIIIDDARCFGTLPDYPTLDEVKGFIHSKRPNLDIAVQDDAIFVTPRK